MQGVLQQNIQEISFKLSIEREDLLIKKYSFYRDKLRSKDLQEMINEFEKTARSHIEMINDKREILNPKGSLK